MQETSTLKKPKIDSRDVEKERKRVADLMSTNAQLASELKRAREEAEYLVAQNDQLRQHVRFVERQARQVEKEAYRAEKQDSLLRNLRDLIFCKRGAHRR